MSENRPKPKRAHLVVDKKTHSLPLREGTEGETVLDIRKLHAETGLRTFDPGFVNTAACRSAITYLDGANGVLRYRGYDVEDLVKNARFVEVAYLLIHGELPTEAKGKSFSELLNRHSLIHEDMRNFFRHYPDRAHPMAVLTAMVVSLSTFYPEMEEGEASEPIDIASTRLLSKLRTIAAFSYKKSIGEPFVYPKRELRYTANFLNMMFASPVSDFEVDPVVVKALDTLLILHADHEQNCSTSAVRLIGSAGANLYAAVAAGICALWGPLHGGANEAVIKMLARIQKEEGGIAKAIERAKNPKSNFRLMGFGHRVYKTYDPRARIAKGVCKNVLKHLGNDDDLLKIALELEEAALADDYFKERNLYPNIDFYTGLTFRAMRIPTDMFTVMFAIGRLPGWIANWLEWCRDPAKKIGRPHQLYVGPTLRKVLPVKDRE